MTAYLTEVNGNEEKKKKKKRTEVMWVHLRTYSPMS